MLFLQILNLTMYRDKYGNPDKLSMWILYVVICYKGDYKLITRHLVQCTLLLSRQNNF